MIDDDTINRWIGHPGPIQLRHAPRKSTRSHDMRAARGICIAVLFCADLIVWGVVIARLL